MKFISMFFLLLAMTCSQQKKETTQIKKEMLQEIFIVLKNPKNIEDAKALITNSGLTWKKLVVDNQSLKAAVINVPIDKKDFWLQRLKESNAFSVVKINSKEVLEKVTASLEKTFVKVRKTHCSGDCPVYDVTFFKDGKVLFNGIENVVSKGEKEFNLTSTQLTKVKALFSEISFNNYSNAVKVKSIMDFSSTFIQFQNKEIEIKLWKNVPDKLIIAHEYLEGILLERKLIL